jgi:copper chaperone NosL
MKAINLARRQGLRTSIKWAGAMALVALLPACNRTMQQAVALEPGSDTACVLDGMVLKEFPGPKGQAHYAEGAPDFYCDLIELFTALLMPEQKRLPTAIFVQDMGKTDWDHPEGNWIDAKTAFYVTASRKRGSMGPTFGSFSSQQDAENFAKKEGGQTMRFAQITPDMVNLTGGVAHDASMSR